MATISNDVRNYFKLDLLQARSYVLFRQLFKNRYSQFNGGKLWDDTSTCGTAYFNNVISKNKNINLTAVQKTSVTNGNTNEWDLTILATLLINGDRPKSLNKTQIQQLDTEDKLVKQLKDIRNKLAHCASKSVTDVEFNQIWSDLRSILLALGDIDTELDKLKDDSVYSNHQLNRSMKKMTKKQVVLIRSASLLAGVPDRDRAVFYSNMSSTRLALHEKGSNRADAFHIDDPIDQRYRALQDAKQARNLWSTWWKGHLRVGKAYAALNEHEKAINSFERALALAPTNGDIQIALDDSRDILSRQLRYEHLDPGLTPKTVQEQLNELEEELGIDPEEVRTVCSLLEKRDPATADVVKGYKYEHGDDGVKQDYEQAAKYFAKAASQGNAAGMYYLALLTDRGFGVKKDRTTATTLLEQAAAQAPQHPVIPASPKIGVAEAEHALGLRYAEGIAVHKNLPTAVCWYQRAVDHGSAPSANNLALMYEEGVGVEKDLKKSQQLFELAARGGISYAMLRLAEISRGKNDLHMAKIWSDRACKAGNLMAKMNRDQFEKQLQEQQDLLNKWSPNDLKFINTTKQIVESINNVKSAWQLSNQSLDYDYDMLNDYAKLGYITAKKMCDAFKHFFEAFKILIQSRDLTDDEENTFVHHLGQCYRLEHIVARIPGMKMCLKTEKIVDRVLERCNNASITAVPQLDEDARICYTLLHIDSQELIVEFLRVCKQKYPKSIVFFEFSSAVNGCLKRYEAALFEANSGLQLDPNYCELLYLKAVALRLIGKDMNEAIKAYQIFLLRAPKDHRKVPESYYAMASCYLWHDRTKGVTDIIRQTYNQGEEAEIIQLPCFLPYKSTSKTLLKPVLDIKSFLSAETNPVIDHKLRLENPHRIEVITHHREWESTTLLANTNSKIPLHSISLKPRLEQQTGKSLIGLKSITLREMNPTKDYVYNRCVLSVTIIEQAYSWTPSIHLVIEDEHLDCERTCVYNFPKGQGEYLTAKVFTTGSKMHLINPYLRISATDRKSSLRIDDFSSIIMQSESERVVNMCRCCGEANAPYLCSKCKQARYCSKECQKMDWQLYKHKLICKSE